MPGAPPGSATAEGTNGPHKMVIYYQKKRDNEFCTETDLKRCQDTAWRASSSNNRHHYIDSHIQRYVSAVPAPAPLHPAAPPCGKLKEAVRVVKFPEKEY